MFNFTPAENDNKLIVPDVEDARSGYAPYYRSGKNVNTVKQEVSAEMAKLDRAVFKFVEGVFEVNGQKRHGFEIYFMYAGRQGVIRVAGLPMRSESKAKIETVKVQALLNVRDWLKAEVTAQIFAPGHDPLLGHMLLPDGKTTVSEYIRQQNDLPLLESGGNGIVIEKE